MRRRRPRSLFDRRQALASSILDQVVRTLVNLLAPLNPVLSTAALGELGTPTLNGGSGDAVGQAFLQVQ